MRIPKSQILFASDTTDRINWGARSASLALLQLLTHHYESVDALAGECATTAVSINCVLPTSVASPLLARRHRNVFLGAYYRFETAFGMKPDYIELDPEPL